MDEVACNKCKLHKDCPNVKVGQDTKELRPLMVIKMQPEEGEVTGFEKSDILKEVCSSVVGVKPEDVSYTYVVRCAGQVPTKKEIQACREHLIELIRDTKPQTIIALGEDTFKALGLKGSMTKNRGKITTWELEIDEQELNIPVVLTYTEEYIKENEKYLLPWANDILKAYNLSKGVVTSNSPTKNVYCDSLELIEKLVGYVHETKLAVFDFETVEIDSDLGVFHTDFKATVLSISFQAGSGYTIPLFHKDSPYKEETVYKILDYLRTEIFENSSIRKIAHNIKFDWHVLMRYSITLKGRIDDTMLMHHLYDETTRHGLKEIVGQYFPQYAGYDDEIKGMKWDSIPLPQLTAYAATDTDMTYRLAVMLESWLLEDERVYKIYRNLTMPAVRVLFQMERRGMLVDKNYLRKAIHDVNRLIEEQDKKLRKIKQVKRYELHKKEQLLDKAIRELEDKLVKWRETHKTETATEKKMVEKLSALKTGSVEVYEGINFGSPIQLQDLLYWSPNGFEFMSFNKTTDKDVLNDIDDDTGFIEGLLTLRSLQKTNSTYLDGVYRRLDDENIVHTSFNIHGTASGRLSSSNPNLQNLPNTAKLKSELLKEAVGMVKKSFIPRKNRVLIQFDYAQAELRIIAAFANETAMLEVYRQNGDLHSKTAAGMLRIAMEYFDKKIPEHGAARSKAKAVNFGLIYGMSAEGFQEYAKNSYGVIMTLEEAIETRDIFFETYPKLLEYHETYIAKGRKFGHVRTLYGRKRHLPNIHNDSPKLASMDERVAINSPIQGTAGEFTVFALVLLQHRLPKDIWLLNTIHDSIIVDCERERADEAIRIVTETMGNLPNIKFFDKELSIGMSVDYEGSDTSWKDLSEDFF